MSRYQYENGINIFEENHTSFQRELKPKLFAAIQAIFRQNELFIFII